MLDTSLFYANTSSMIYIKVNNNKGKLESFLIKDGEVLELITINKVKDGFKALIYYKSDNSIYLTLLNF
jgi:hypothetical protein